MPRRVLSPRQSAELHRPLDRSTDRATEPLLKGETYYQCHFHNLVKIPESGLLFKHALQERTKCISSSFLCAPFRTKPVTLGPELTIVPTRPFPYPDSI